MSRPIESGNYKKGQNQAHVMSADGSIDRSEFQDDFQVIDAFNYRNIADMAKFMNEPVLVSISNTTDKNAAQVIFLSVDGVPQYLIRGVKQYIKRKYLEVLARAKPVEVSTQEFINANQDRATRIIKNVGEQYGFTVHEDRNPDGYAWLQQVLAEPQ